MKAIIALGWRWFCLVEGHPIGYRGVSPKESGLGGAPVCAGIHPPPENCRPPKTPQK